MSCSASGAAIWWPPALDLPRTPGYAHCVLAWMTRAKVQNGSDDELDNTHLMRFAWLLAAGAQMEGLVSVAARARLVPGPFQARFRPVPGPFQRGT